MTRGRTPGLGPAVAVVVVLFGGALVGALRTSLQPGAAGALGEVSLTAWRAALSDPAFGDALAFSLWIAAGATALAALAAVPLALGLRRHGPLVRSLVGTPVLVPHLVVAVVAVFWLGPGGLADRLVGALPVVLVRDQAGWGIILVYAYKEAPFLALFLLASLDRGVSEREEAAAVLGAGPWQRFGLVLWPALRRPLGVGALIVGAFTFGAFEVPLVVGPTHPPTLPVLALRATRGDLLTGQAEAAAILLVAAAVPIVLTVAAAGLLHRGRL